MLYKINYFLYILIYTAKNVYQASIKNYRVSKIHIFKVLKYATKHISVRKTSYGFFLFLDDDESSIGVHNCTHGEFCLCIQSKSVNFIFYKCAVRKKEYFV